MGVESLTRASTRAIASPLLWWCSVRSTLDQAGGRWLGPIPPARGKPSLLVAIDYLQLLVTERPAKFPLAALRWHGRFEPGQF